MRSKKFLELEVLPGFIWLMTGYRKGIGLSRRSEDFREWENRRIR
jgi:hypothetical protein